VLRAAGALLKRISKKQKKKKKIPPTGTKLEYHRDPGRERERAPLRGGGEGEEGANLARGSLKVLFEVQSRGES
jgi:hypothetical protein